MKTDVGISWELRLAIQGRGGGNKDLKKKKRGLAALTEDLSSDPSLCLPMTPAVGDPTLSSGLRGHTRAHGAHKVTRIHTPA